MSIINTSTEEKKSTEKRYMYWIHCMKCFELYIHKKRNFLFLACHHVCCVKCAPSKSAPDRQAAPAFKCPICNKLVRGRQLNNMMPPDIKELFHPKPYLSDLPNGRVVNFQRTIRQHFVQGMIRLVRCVNKLENNSELVRLNARRKFEQLEAARRERKMLEKRVHLIRAKRKRMEEKRLEQKELLRQSQYAPHSTIGESGIRHGTHSRSRTPPFSRAGAGRGSLTPPTTPLRGSEHGRINSNDQRVRSFAQKRNNAFNL